MRVGIFLSSTLPEAGGASTVESTLIFSLLELASKLPHTFIIYGWHQNSLITACQSLKNIEFRSYTELFINAVKRKPHQAFLAGVSQLGQQQNIFQYSKWKEALLRDALQSDQIEVAWYLAPRPLIRDIPYIMTVWDLQHRLQPFFPEVSNNNLWEQRENYYQTILRRASFVITGTEAGKAEIEFFYHVPESRIRILPLPTPAFVLSPPNEIKSSILEKHQLSPGYLFYPAQFWAHKNHANLLLALNLLRQQQFPLQLVLVGSDKGSQQYIQQQVAELKLNEQVKFLGFVSQTDLVVLYQNALALTFVSFFGPDNLPPLEAFSLKCPVIAADVQGAEEQLGDAALRVDPQSPEDIATAIKQIYSDPALKQTLIKRGYERSQSWNGHDYVMAISDLLSQFASVRRCWQT